MWPSAGLRATRADPLEIEPVKSLDPLRPIAHVRADAVEVGADAALSSLTMTNLVDRCDMVFHLAAAVGVKLIVDQLMKRLREQMKVHEVSIELTDAAKEVK